jgi:hypothetical protein
MELIGLADGKWLDAGSAMVNLIATEITGVWSGAFIGMHSSGNGKPCNSYADFDYFTAHFIKVPLNDM